MKITYLVYDRQGETPEVLSVISQEEWQRIIAANQTASASERRYFESDVIVEGREIDMIVIEVSREEHRRINAEKKAAFRRREQARPYRLLSLEALEENGGGAEILRRMRGESLEDAVSHSVDMELLRKALAQWRPWANEMLDCCLQGQERHCTALLARKYGVSGRQIRNYRAQLKNFLRKFYF